MSSLCLCSSCFLFKTSMLYTRFQNNIQHRNYLHKQHSGFSYSFRNTVEWLCVYISIWLCSEQPFSECRIRKRRVKFCLSQAFLHQWCAIGYKSQYFYTQQIPLGIVATWKPPSEAKMAGPSFLYPLYVYILQY
jgi:hypothetical protein